MEIQGQSVFRAVPFPPTRLTAPGSPRMAIGKQCHRLFSHDNVTLHLVYQVAPAVVGIWEEKSQNACHAMLQRFALCDWSCHFLWHGFRS